MLIAACSVLASTMALASPGRTDGVDPAAAAWIKSHAIPFTTSQAGHGFDDLAPLDKVIGDARIVALGEPTHGTRDAFQMKHRLLEYLVEQKGFRIFSIEANMPEAYALNEYIVDGKGDPAKLVAGMYFWTWNTQEVLDMVEWMRAWNVAHPPAAGAQPLRFTGFDMQTSTVAANIATEFLQKQAPELVPEAKTAFANAESLNFEVGDTAASFASATGSFPAAAAKGKKLVLSGWIRTEGVEEWAGIWWRCDTSAGPGAFNNMQDQKISGTTDWKRYEFTLDCNPDTTGINFGFLLSGPGTAWFDDVEITLDGVKYEDPARFTFDFENDEVKYLSMPRGNYAVSRVETAPHAGKKCLQLRRLPDPKPGEKVDPKAAVAAAKKVLDAMVARRDELAAKAGATETDWAIQNARIVWQRARMFDVDDMQKGSGIRDECMADNVEWILQHNPGAKIVLWAHNAHVSRGSIWGTTWMGRSIEAKFPGQMVVFGFATGKGTYTAAGGVGKSGLSSDHVLQEPPATSVEAYLASAGQPRLLLDIRAARKDDPGSGWALTSIPIRSIGAMAMEEQFFPIVPKEMFDILVWQEQTGASVPLKKAP